MLFIELLADAASLERGDVVDEELAVEVVDLMLDADRQQAVGFHGELFTVAVASRNANLLGALYRFVEAGDGKAAFIVLTQGIAFFLKQLGGHPDKRERMNEWPVELRIRQTPPLED